MRCLRYAGLVAGSLLGMSSAQAADVFSIDVTITEQDPTIDPYFVMDGTSNAESIIDLLSEENLRALAPPQFNGDERIESVLDFRGVPIELNYPNFANQANGSQLVFAIPELELNQTFDGATRQDSLEQFKDFLKANEGDIVSRLYQLLAQRSPNDPIAGNPGSLQSNRASSDFRQGFTHKVSQIWGCGTSAANEQIMLAKAGFACGAEVAALPAIEVAQATGTATDMPSDSLYGDYFRRAQRIRGENKVTLGLQYASITASSASAAELKTSVVTLPLAYTVVFNGDPRKKLSFQLPISMSKTEEADSFQAGLGIAYNHPMSGRWSLTPAAGYSVVGSEDLAAASAMSSFSLTSSYTFDIGGWALNMGNMIGSYATQKVKVGDYESDPGISNTVISNGFLLSGPSSLLAKDLVLEYFINDTRYTGDDLFTDNAQEIGINFGRVNTQHEVVTSYLKGSISYLTASGDNDAEADVLRLSLIFKF